MANHQENSNQVDSTTALRSRKQPQPGDVLDGIYRLDQPLGKGGVGIVYRAFHLHLQRSCAIKFMHPQLVANAELRTRFRREAQSAFQLGHPHIVAITDFRDDPNAWPYLVMELVVGETLRDRLEKGALEPRLAVHLIIELCAALVAAHRRGVIHRDLKPENLFLTQVASPGPGEFDVTLKVLDFGLSKLLDGVEITGSGRLLGSPSYMSPEQARGDSHLVDVRSDIFSVGALLYECLVGEKMFNAETIEQKRQMIIAAKLPPLQFGGRGLPNLDKIIARACALKPEQRYQSAAALQAALEEAEKALAGKPTAPLFIPVPVDFGNARPPGERSSAVASVGGGELVTGRTLAKRRRPGLWLMAISASLIAISLGGFAGYSAWRTFVAPQPSGHLGQQSQLGAFGARNSSATFGHSDSSTTGVAVPAATKDLAESVTQIEKPAPAVDLQLRLADEISDGGTGTDAAPAPVEDAAAAATPPVAPSRAKRPYRGSRPIATAPTPPSSVPPAHGGSLLEIVQKANDTLRRATPAVKRCYPPNVTPPDKISVDITIQADGRVSEANIEGAEDSADCVLRVLRGLRFAPAADSDSYATRYDFVNLRR